MWILNLPLFLVALMMFPGANQGAGKVIDVGSQKQLFIDRRFITSDSGIRLTVNPPVKANTVLVPDKPWDLGWIVGYGSVLEDRGKYRMWYTALPPAGKIEQNLEGSLLCYAESEDGVRWTKPNLRVFEWEGSKDNNILLRVSIETSTVFIDPKAADAERYKLVASFLTKDKAPNGNPGMYIYTSPDGLRWKFHPTLLFPFTPDSQNQAFYDARINKYVIYVRQWDVREAGLYGPCCRNVGRIETDDILRPWPYQKGITPKLRFGKDKVPPPTGEVPVAFGRDEQDPKFSDHYTSAAAQYPWAADANFIFPSAYLHTPNPPKGKFSNDGPLDIQLAVSRDGVTYHRPERKPYVELGIDGAQDGGSIYMLVGMVRNKDEVYQYYSAYPYTHAGYRGLKEEVRQGAVIRLVQRLDGFVSADADMASGSFKTPPLKFKGDRLTLNMNASGMGEVLVELQDENGVPVSGYSFADCDPLHQNHIRKVVTWNGKPDLGALSGKPLRIAFRLRAAKLYAFQFEP